MHFLVGRDQRGVVKADAEVLSQVDYPLERLEAVVIDDGSTDNTPGVVEMARPLFGEGLLRYDRIPR